MCSWNDSGTPYGTATLGTSDDALAAMPRRRSISRTSSVNCSRRTRSLCETSGNSSLRLPLTESRMLACCSRRALRSSGELPSPNMRSKIVCGLISMGSGRSGACQEIVFV